MNAFETEFGKRLFKRMAAVSTDKTLQLRAGSAYSHEDYKFRVGYLQGMDDVEQMMRDVEKEMTER